MEGKAGLGGIAPHGSRSIALYDPQTAEDWTETQDIWLTISVRFREKQEWTEEEHYEAAFHQECIKEAEPAAHPVSEGTESGGLCFDHFHMDYLQ